MNTRASASRRTDRPQPAPRKRAFRFWTGRVLLGLGIILVALSAFGASYQAVATMIDQQTYAPPGQLVDVGGHRMHIHCMGAGSPTVILDAEPGNTSASWGLIQPEVARSTRVCSYDRAGLGWSDKTTAPHDARQIARDLHTLLGAAGIPGPYVLVGHSGSALDQQHPSGRRGGGSPFAGVGPQGCPGNQRRNSPGRRGGAHWAAADRSKRSEQ